MIRMPIHELRTDDVLARSIINPTDPNKIILSRGKSINSRMLSILPRVGLRSVWIEGDGKDLCEEALPESALTQYRELVGHLNHACDRVRQGDVPVDLFIAFREPVLALWRFLESQNGAYLVFEAIHEEGSRIGFHSVNVCHLSLLLARELPAFIHARDKQPAELSEIDIVNIGLGALLHDIGKAGVSLDILNKEAWDLTQREVEEAQSHTQRGFRLLRSQVGTAVAGIALAHHLTADGAGYPLEADVSGATDENSPLAWIVSAANAYDGLITREDYRPIEALEEINCARPHQFDDTVRAALNRVVPVFAIGDIVTLSSGHRAAVGRANAAHPFQPDVLMLAEADGQLLPESQRLELKLADYANTRIVRAGGRPIEHLLPKNLASAWEDVV